MGLAAGFWFWACVEEGGVAFRDVAAEEEGLGATLGGAGACFLVPESTSPVHVISFLYIWIIYKQARSSGHGTT